MIAGKWFEPDGRMSAADFAEELSDTYLGGLVRPLRGAERATADAAAAPPRRSRREVRARKPV